MMDDAVDWEAELERNKREKENVKKELKRTKEDLDKERRELKKQRERNESLERQVERKVQSVLYFIYVNTKIHLLHLQSVVE